MIWFRSRYTRFLEQQVTELKEQLQREREEHRLDVQALIPALRRASVKPAEVQTAAPADTKKVHKITKAENNHSASCLCGWQYRSEDPVELQNEISAHYRTSFVPLKMAPPRWSGSNGMRAKMENGQEDPLLAKKQA
jgi:hypothetical protein